MFDIQPDSTAVEPTVIWRMELDVAREIADLLSRLDDPRANEMAFDLRQGVQVAVSIRGNNG